MGEKCSELIGSLGGSWVPAGWVLFASWFLLPMFVGANNLAAGTVTFIVGFALWLLWWFIDAMDQDISWWQWLTGIVMVAFFFVPRGGFLAIAAWVIYWTRVRE